MKFSKNWLQIYIKEDLPEDVVVEQELNSKAFEVEEIKKIIYIENGQDISDTIFDIKILPNRAHDALSHAFMAKELAIILDLNFKKELLDFREIKNNLDLKNREQKNENKIEVEVLDNKACSRFMCVKIDGIKVENSPEWLKNKLESIGQKSINNIVDITNYVQFTLNKPMHAYDAREIKEKIIVRYAREDEELETLDDKNLKLDDKTLVIADNEKALGLAGIKGGKYSGVQSDTTSIVIESANFNSVLIRKTSQKYNLKTDASKRFENGIANELVAEGFYMTVNEILKMFPDAKVGAVTDTNDILSSKYNVGVTIDEINKTLGSDYDKEFIENILKRFNFKYEILNTKKYLEENIDKVLGAKYKNPSSMRIDAPKYFSCSSLVSYLYKGIWMPSITVDKYVWSKRIEKKDLQFGDLVFASTGEGKIYFKSIEFMKGTKVPDEGIDHMAIYIGDDKVLHATRVYGETLIESYDDFIMTRKVVGFGRVERFDEERYVIEIPDERLDLRIKEDIIEEIGRVAGYDKLTPILPNINKINNDTGKGLNVVNYLNKKLNYQNIIRNILNQKGFLEIITYTFTNQGDITLLKSASDKNELRNNLSSGLVEAMNKNIYNMPLLNTDVIKVYEFGSVFSTQEVLDIENKKEIKIVEKLHLAIGYDDGKKKTNFSENVDMILREIKLALGVPSLEFSITNQKPYVVEIDFDDTVKDLDVLDRDIYLENVHDDIKEERIIYKTFSQMPFIVRDVAFWCEVEEDKNSLLKNLEVEARKSAGGILISVNIFDEFVKEIEGVKKKSLGYRFIYQATDKTLTDEEVNGYIENVYNLLKEKGFEIR